MSALTDGQVAMLVVLLAVCGTWGAMVAFEAWLDTRSMRRDPVIRGLRGKADR